MFYKLIMLYTYIALLRGINVGGHNKIKMDVLRQCCSELGWKNVKTYIQSGNVIFQSAEKDTNLLAESLAFKLREHLEKTISILVVSLPELQEMYENNPFIIDRHLSTDKLHLVILKDAPTAEQINQIPVDLYKPDEFILRGKALYLYLPNGVADSKLANTSFEKKFNTQATARNWKTLSMLFGMVSNLIDKEEK
jgi:uncharacterized protein (DUF1697 family)